MSKPFKIFNIALAALMAVTSIASSIAAVRYIVVSAVPSGKQLPSTTLHVCMLSRQSSQLSVMLLLLPGISQGSMLHARS